MSKDKNTDFSKTALAVKTPNTGITNFTNEQLELIVEASASTGVKSKGEALMIFQKARELGIGAANAIPHMHIVNGKSGIDIHIVKAILSRPSSGVTWKLIDEYKPIYAIYSDGKSTFDYDSLPDNYILVSKISGNPLVDKYITEGKTPIVALPTKTKTGNVLQPIDRITVYSFERIKHNLKGDWITVKTTSSFRWSEAIAAQLPLDKSGQINPNSNWSKYPKLMLGIRAFTYGARDIASDLLLGNYETSELYEMNNINYDIDNEGRTEIIDVDTNFVE